MQVSLQHRCFPVQFAVGRTLPVKRRQDLAETDRESCYKEERLEELLDSKGVFYNGNESDNHDERCNENNKQQQLPEGFVNSCYKIVSLILLQRFCRLQAPEAL